MTTKTALQGAVQFAGPLVLAAGTAMLTVSLASSEAGGSSGQVALPRPTVTATVTATPMPSQVGQPPAPVATATIQPVILPADPISRGNSSPGDSGNPGGGGPEPTAPPADPDTPQECSGGQIVSVRVPLLLLPCNAIQVGGARPN